MASTHAPARPRAAAGPRPPAERTVLSLEAVLAVAAFGGAGALIAGVTDLGEATARLPFGSSVLAGVALGLVNGVLPASVVVGAWRRRWWAGPGHLVVGAALILWIVTQVIVLGPPVVALQVVSFVWGWCILLLALHLRNRDRRRRP